MNGYGCMNINAGFEVMSSVLNLQWAETMMSLCEKWLVKMKLKCAFTMLCCDIDEADSHELSGLPEVLSVRPDRDFESAKKDYSLDIVQLGGVSNLSAGTSRLFSEGNSKYWLVRMEKPTVEVLQKRKWWITMLKYYQRFWESQCQLLL
ncbi:organelle RRM domain-containing protein 1, chloroplastic-like [Papaver somniferum]|uniref:organelle RRM domain-containing protein 1, chloroplastic-like n=1 Tax=Papaver somniferum TaxID=3469 RepID=UPI000E6FC32D|nr:organelle RRM domain-containing protein 1, chloroplastic-like [Papaver somniferum]